MAMKPRDRWIVLAVALVLTLAAVRWAGSQDREAVALSARAAAEPARRSEREPAGARGTERLPGLDLERLAVRKQNAPAGDPFAARSWEAMAQEAARKSARPPPPPPPLAPPLPFVYMGRLVEDGGTTVFLTRLDRLYIVRAGDTLDGLYRVEAITARSMTVTYLLLGQRQELAFGSEN